MNTHIQAATDSLNAAASAFDQSPLDPYAVAYAVGMEAAERDRERAARAEREAEAATPVQRTPALLGCWINGKLRFQSRDHDAIHDYAAKHMAGARNFGNNVWVAPVGSFIDTEAAKEVDRRAMRKVHKASKKVA